VQIKTTYVKAFLENNYKQTDNKYTGEETLWLKSIHHGLKPAISKVQHD
jgi:hypothetical protein